MSHPVGGGEAVPPVPGAGVPGPEAIEAIDPLAVRLRAAADLLGRALTPGEVWVGTQLYSGGRVDQVAEIYRTTAAAQGVQAEAVAAPAEEAPGEQPAAPAAQTEEGAQTQAEEKERLDNPYPQTLTVRLLDKPTDVYTFANERGHAAYEQASKKGTVIGGFTTGALEAQGRSDKPVIGAVRPHEVVAYSDTQDAYEAHMPANARDEMQVGVTYHASMDAGLGPLSVTLRTVLPFTAAERLDEILATGNPIPARAFAENAIILELKNLGNPDQLQGKEAEEYDALQRALLMINDGKGDSKFDDDEHRGKNAAVITLSNVGGLGAGNLQGGPVNGYDRRVVPLKKNYPEPAKKK